MSSKPRTSSSKVPQREGALAPTHTLIAWPCSCSKTRSWISESMSQADCERLETRLRLGTTPTEGMSSGKVEAVKTGNEALKEHVHKLNSERIKLQEEVRHKEELIKKEVRERQTSTKSYLPFLDKLSEMENKLEKVERKWRRKVEQLEDEDKLLNQETNHSPMKRGMSGRFLPHPLITPPPFLYSSPPTLHP